MKLSMKEILDKYNDANKFSLTGSCSGYKITEEEFMNAIKDMEEHNKERHKKIYQIRREKFNDPEYDVDKVYEEIKEECIKYRQEHKKSYVPLRELYSPEELKQYIQITEQYTQVEDTDALLDRLIEVGDSITSCVGKTTKYDNNFSHIYHDVDMTLKCLEDKEKYLSNGVLDPLDAVPEELKEYLLYYEVSFHNEVSTRSILMINYYFVLNDATKKYLLKFKDDFNMDELEDLTLYKDDQVLFYSCTHEKFNSLSDE